MTHLAKKMSAYLYLATQDVRTFRQITDIPRKRLAIQSGVAEGLVRGMEEPDWRPSIKTVTRLEAKFGRHPDWVSNSIIEEVETVTDDELVIRRDHRLDSPYLPDEIRGALDILPEVASRPDRLEDYRNINLVDATAPHPSRYRVVHHCLESIEAGHLDATSQCLGEFRSEAFRWATQWSYLHALGTRAAIVSEILWAKDGSTEGPHFWRVLYPAKDGGVYSFVSMVRANVAGALLYNEIASALEA